MALACADEAGGSGCYNIFYTADGTELGPSSPITDGTEPDISSLVYSAPISVSSSMSVRFFSIDNAGNREDVQTSAYTIGTVAVEPAIATGVYHSVALKNDGTVWAWGDNSSGQLGDGSKSWAAGPVRVKSLKLK